MVFVFLLLLFCCDLQKHQTLYFLGCYFSIFGGLPNNRIHQDPQHKPRHPDKVRSCEPAEAKAAFARLDAAAKVLEALFDPRL